MPEKTSFCQSKKSIKALASPCRGTFFRSWQFLACPDFKGIKTQNPGFQRCPESLIFRASFADWLWSNECAEYQRRWPSPPPSLRGRGSNTGGMVGRRKNALACPELKKSKPEPEPETEPEISGCSRCQLAKCRGFSFFFQTAKAPWPVRLPACLHTHAHAHENLPNAIFSIAAGAGWTGAGGCFA